MANSLDTQLKEPSFWYTQLQQLDLHKLKLEDFKNIPEAYQAITGEQIQQTFAKYATPARSVRVVASPKEDAAEKEDEKAEPAAKPGKE